MGFADDYYYGQCKLICTTTTTADNGKTVSVVSGSGRTWSGTVANKVCTFLLPNRDSYTVKLMSGSTVQHQETVYLGYGECKMIMIGMDKNTPEGIKAIVQAGLESSFFTVGNTINFTEGSTSVQYRVLHVGYRTSKYGHNVIFGRDKCLNTTRVMNDSATNAGGFASSGMCRYLNNDFYNSLSSDLKNVITTCNKQLGIGNSTSLQAENHKIWLPSEWNVFGATTYAAATEKTTGGEEQLSFFATAANRVRQVNGAASIWWLASPHAGSATDFCIVTAAGAANSGAANYAYGVLPCFMIAA